MGVNTCQIPNYLSSWYNAAVTPDLTAAEWDAFVEAQTAYPPSLSNPAAHIMQTSAWADLKMDFGWSAVRVVARKDGEIVAGAQMLFRPLPLALGAIGYVPMGPIVDWNNRELTEYLLALLDEIARSNNAVFLKIEPDLADDPETDEVIASYGLRPSPQSIQPRQTILMDLRPEEGEILARMKQKTRYNIRLAQKKDVTTRLADNGSAASDVTVFNQLIQLTGSRDGFGVHSPAYYHKAFEYLSKRDRAALILAEHKNHPLAALMVFTLQGRAWYFYGASSNEERQRMPAYAAQWQAIRWAKAQGCHTYDLWGIPDAAEFELESQFTDRKDGLWPVYRFKRGFGGQIARRCQSWDKIYVPWAYRLYLWYLKRRNKEPAA